MKTQTGKGEFAKILIAMGLVYGDIGTSVLYTFRAIISNRPLSEGIILGGLSCIFWTLTLMTTLKYIILALRADNKGEGGIFALYTLVRGKGKWTIFPAMIGGVALLADGIMTPAVSITASVEGLNALPSLTIQDTTAVVFLVIGIVSAVFFVQQFGAEKIGSSFGPVMCVWFSVLAVLGIAQIVHEPGILRAVSPVYAYEMISTDPHAFMLLGAVFLCTTGAEAVYSDLGHCGREPIRRAWTFVKVCLLLNYFGQAAYMWEFIGQDVSGKNPFFDMMPTWFLVFGVLIATAASIIASQALISGSFSLISEAARLHLWPKFKILYPTESKGQLYIPTINTMLYIGCVGVVLFFRKSENMEAAYGLTITIGMLMTSTLLVMHMHKRVAPVWIALFILVYFSLEGSFFLANMSKFFHGAYVSFLVASALGVVSYTWYVSRRIKNKHIQYDDIRLCKKGIMQLSQDETIPKTATHLIYLTRGKQPHIVEKKVIYSLFAGTPKRANYYWLVTVHTLDEPSACNYTLSILEEKKIFRLDFYLGFRVPVQLELLVRKSIANTLEEKHIELDNDYQQAYYPQPIGKYRFVSVQDILSHGNNISPYEKIILQLKLLIKRLVFSESNNFGIDESSLIKEYYPLILQETLYIPLRKKEPQ